MVLPHQKYFYYLLFVQMEKRQKQLSTDRDLLEADRKASSREVSHFEAVIKQKDDLIKRKDELLQQKEKLLKVKEDALGEVYWCTEL